MGLFAASAALADPQQSVANQRNMLPGDRAAMMGGAYTAIADDASASYYNPAGLAFVTRERLEGSSTAYRTTELVYKETVGDEPFDERSATIYPSFLGGTAKAGPLTVGYSFMTLDARNVYQQNKYADISTAPGAASTYSRTYQEASTYIWAGGSAALKLGSRWSIGSSLFYYQRNIKFTTAELVQLNGGGIVTVNDTLATLNTGLAGVQGIKYQGDVLSFGFALKTAMALSNNSILLQDEVVFDPTAQVDDDSQLLPTVTNTRTNYKALNEMNPTTYAAGLALRPWSWLTVATDVYVHEGVKSRYKRSGGHDLNTTVNYSAGLLLDFGLVSLLGGAFTNNSMYREPSPERTDQPTHLDYRGYSWGFGWALAGLEGLLGYMRQYGEGKSQIRRGSTDIQDVEGNITTYLISGKVPL